MYSELSQSFAIRSQSKTAPVEASLLISGNFNETKRKHSTVRRVATAVVLTLLNVLNFFDRSIYGVVLPQITATFDISNSQAGLLQTMFVVAIMIAAPIAGVVGRKFSRKWVIIVGATTWSAAAVLGPILNRDGENFGAFCAIRAFSGVGESCLATLAVTLFADMFSDRVRPLVLSIFMGAILLGGALAYLLGPIVTKNLAGVWDLKGWVWVTSGTGVVGAILIIPAIFIIPDIPVEKSAVAKQTTVKDDIKYLLRCRTYLITLLGYTCFSFSLAAKQYWTVTILNYASQMNDEINVDDLTMIISFIVLVCGYMGSAGVAEVARIFKNRGTQGAQPIATGVIGMFSGLSCLFFVYLVTKNLAVAMVFYGLTNVTLSCWVGTTHDILMSVSPPIVRPVASGMATLVAHLLGDGFSPTMLGTLSDALLSGHENTYVNKFDAIQQAFFLAEVISTLGGTLYLIAAIFMPADMKKLRETATGDRRRKSGQTQQKMDDPRVAFAKHQEENGRYKRSPSGGGTIDLPKTVQRGNKLISEDPFVPLDESDSEQHSNFN